MNAVHICKNLELHFTFVKMIVLLSYLFGIISWTSGTMEFTKCLAWNAELALPTVLGKERLIFILEKNWKPRVTKYDSMIEVSMCSSSVSDLTCYSDGKLGDASLSASYLCHRHSAILSAEHGFSFCCFSESRVARGLVSAAFLHFSLWGSGIVRCLFSLEILLNDRWQNKC